MSSPQVRPALPRLARLRIGAIIASAVILAAAAGIGAVLASDPGPVQYTGCLSKLTGIPYNVQVGTTPLHGCLAKDPIASWNNIGPAGPPGLPGAPGKPGTNGTNGTDGQPGLNGAQGIQGIQGIPGIDGTNGTNGTDGQDGASLSAVPLPPGDTRCGPAGGSEIFQTNPGPQQISQGVLCNGAKGDKGDPGSGVGSTTAYDNFVILTPPITIDNGFVTPISLRLPAGTYMVFGRAQVGPAVSNEFPAYAGCFIPGAFGSNQASAVVEPHRPSVTTSPYGMLILLAPTDVQLRCGVNSSAGESVNWLTANLDAIKIDTLSGGVAP